MKLLKNYIPKDKFDFDAAEILKSLPFEVIKPDIPELLEWLQDMNWPIAGEIADYFIPHINVIRRDLIYILNTNDGMWEYWIINSLLARSNQKLDEELIKAVKRIADNPTPIEVEDGVSEIANDLLSRVT